MATRTSTGRADDPGQSTRARALDRRQMLRRTGGAALGGAVLAQGLSSGTAGASEDEGHDVVGSWIVSIVYGGGDSQRTRGLATFMPGGGFIGSVSAYERAPARPTPSRGTTLHGTWRAKGGRAIGVAAVRLHLDAQGALLGVMQTRIALRLAEGGDAWSGSFTFSAADPSGRVLRTGRGTLEATRIAIEPA